MAGLTNRRSSNLPTLKAVKDPVTTLKLEFLKFDYKAIERSLDAGERRAMNRVGAYIRVSMMNALRRRVRNENMTTQEVTATFGEAYLKWLQAIAARNRQSGKGNMDKIWPKRSAPPGKYPYVRSTKSPLITQVFYLWSVEEQALFVGPLPFEGADVPAAIEFGPPWPSNDKWKMKAAHPWINPTGRAVSKKKKVQNMWKGVVR